MGSSQSIPTTSEITDVPRFAAKHHEEHSASSKNGPKTKSTIENNLISLTTITDDEDISLVVSTAFESDDDYSSLDEEEHELDEFITQRKLVLADAMNLKKHAVDYLHPEKPVVVTEPTMFGRNYFGRASAPTEYDDDDNFLTTLSRVRDGNVVHDMEEERTNVMEDLKKMKTTVEWYLNPEKSVVVSDAAACGRNYFTRISAPTKYDDDDNFLTTLSRVRDSNVVHDMEEERTNIMEDMKQLKTTAEWYLNPEKSVVTDATACGRNYFTRVSALDYEEERERVLDEAAELKKVADWFLHPERPLETTVGTASGRNYFTRASTLEYDNEERDHVMEEMAELKMVADWFLHPEKSIDSNANTCGRNYFTRPSAPEFEEEEMDEERERVLEETVELKTVADWYFSPEKPIVTDEIACGSNFFTRPSSVVQDADDDIEEERERVLAEANQLKQVADWHLHPEKKITVSSTVRGRNFFNRPSGPMEKELNEYRRVLAEAAELKMVAEWYLSPEKPILTGPTAHGRNFFTRPSASEAEDDDMEKERERVRSEATELEMVAAWYFHPERKITVWPAVYGRNFFSRLSAPEEDDDDMEEERESIFSEATELKQLAVWYLNPERKITVEPTACGRNFFSRLSAPEEDDDGDMEEERERILSEAIKLKQVATLYLHPESKITVEPTAYGRNFFSRPLAPEEDNDDDFEEERELILSEATELKRMADWCHNPNQPVASDGFSTGRNYFTRPSAPHEDNMEEERERLLEESADLQKMADWCYNPNQPVISDGFSTGRNYFTRPSVLDYEDDAEEERESVLAEAKKLKEVADWYHNRNQRVVSDGFATARNYFTRPSAFIEDTNEREDIIADVMELKKLAIDYFHPEKPVFPSSVNCVRNYFDRPSAKGYTDYIHTEGHAIHPGLGHMEDHYVMHQDDYHHYDHHGHPDDMSHSSFQSHGDHFDMEEDIFNGFRESINSFRDSVHDQHHIPIIKEEDDGKEGNLSRSPSSIMLFEEPAM